MNTNVYTTIYLLLLVSLGYLATDIYLPSLPALSIHFQATENDAQMTLFSYLLSFSMTPLIFGPLSDHVGRKKVILGGIMISILATFCCLFSGSIQWLIASRCLQGIGTGAVMISARSAVADLFSGKALTKQMSLMAMLMPLVLATAPTLGGILQDSFNWQAVFIFLICYLFLILIFVAIKPESLKHQSHKQISQIFSTYRIHLSNHLFLIFSFNFVLPSLGLFAYLTASPFLFQKVIGLSPVEYGTLALYIGGTILITGYINLKLIHRFALTNVIFAGSCLILLAGGLLMFFHFAGILTTWSVLIPCLIFFTCMPLCIANAASKSLSLIKSHFGAATALLTTFQLLAGSLVSLVFSLIHNETAFSLAVCFVFIGVFSLITLMYGSRLERKMKNDQSKGDHVQKLPV